MVSVFKSEKDRLEVFEKAKKIGLKLKLFDIRKQLQMGLANLAKKKKKNKKKAKKTNSGVEGVSESQTSQVTETAQD
jgi:hypothetical protein